MLKRTLILPVLAALLFAATASAQIVKDENIAEENIDKLAYERPIVEYMCAGGFILASMAIGFMPSKRVHDA